MRTSEHTNTNQRVREPNQCEWNCC